MKIVAATVPRLTTKSVDETWRRSKDTKSRVSFKPNGVDLFTGKLDSKAARSHGDWELQCR